MAEAEAEAEAATVRATRWPPPAPWSTSMPRIPSAATLARWQQLGERWVAGAQDRVIADAANKLDTIADTLTFLAIGDTTCRDRDAVHWLGHCMVRVPEGQVRAAARGRGRGPAPRPAPRLASWWPAGRSRNRRHAVRGLRAVRPGAGRRGRPGGRWAQWTHHAEEQFRTLRHAMEHFAQGGEGNGADDDDTLGTWSRCSSA